MRPGDRSCGAGEFGDERLRLLTIRIEVQQDHSELRMTMGNNMPHQKKHGTAYFVISETTFSQNPEDLNA